MGNPSLIIIPHGYRVGENMFCECGDKGRNKRSGWGIGFGDREYAGTYFPLLGSVYS